MRPTHSGWINWVRLLAALLLAAGLGLRASPQTVHAATITAQNTSTIAIPGSGTSGPASPYPSTINVGASAEMITEVTVELRGLLHTNPADLEVLLVGPSGTAVLLLADNGGSANALGINLTFDDDAATTAPSPLVGGSYRPTGTGTVSFTSPAPGGPYATTLGAFYGQDPEGAWRLFVYDDSGGDSGVFLLGWRLTIITGTPGVTVSPTSGLTTSEAGSGTLFTVALNSRPSAPVFIPLSSSDATEGNPNTAGLTFTPGNWDVPQSVFVVPVDDSVDDGNIPYSIDTGPAISADPFYNNLNAANVSLTNLDDDTAGIVVSSLSGTITTESGGTVTFQVRLQSEPTANVTLPLSSSDPGEGTVSPASLTFTAGNWNTAQTVTVTGVDDFLDDNTQSYTVLVGTASSGDGNYAGKSVSLGLDNTDNDSAGINVGPISVTTSEAGGSATFTIVLNSQPTDNVEIGLVSDDPGEGTVSPSLLTFTAGNWNTAQTVTVTGVDDFLDDGDQTFKILTSASSDDGIYDLIDPADVTVTNTNDDGAGFIVSAINGNTSEAGNTATFTVRLSSQPTAEVTIPLTSSNPGEGTVSPASLTFDGTTWNTPQTVTVTGVDDFVDDGNVGYEIILSTPVSADNDYNTLDPGDVQVTNDDDDTAGVTVAPASGLTTSEAGGTAGFTVVLTSQPTADVVISLSSSDGSEGSASPGSLTFTAANWSTAQSVTVTGVDDVIDDGDQGYTIITTVSNGDGLYTAVNPSDVAVTNTDNDTSAILVNLAGDLETTESGGTDSFTVVLASQPAGNVSFSLSSSDSTEGTVSPGSLTFTPANWSTPQLVTVTGVDDLVDDGDIAFQIISAAAVSSDGLYNGINPADANVTNLDNDTAGITVSPISGNTSEGGAAATFTVRLNSQPTANVSIGLSSSDAGEGTISPASLTFTAANWNVAQTVTLTGVNDDVEDGDILYQGVTAPATSSDAKYNGLNAADVSLFNTDNDGAGILVSALSSAPTEAGGNGTFTVQLTSEPTANVVIALSSSDITEGTVACDAVPSLTFTAANWDEPQTCTVTGVDDFVDDGDVGYTILLEPAVSDDTNYKNLDPADVAVTTLDDDTAGIVVAPTGGLETGEAGDTDSFTVVLTSEPTADVSIALSSNDISEGTVGPASLSFTAEDWDEPQTVTLTGVDDDVDDGDSIYQIITAPAVSDDEKYKQLNPADVTATNTDDDAVGITVAPTGGLFTSEAGGTATFTVVLDSKPSGEVSVGLSSSDTTEGTVSPASVTFTPATWNVAQTVTLTGVGDNVDDGNIVYSILTAAAVSGDPAYGGLNPADVAATNLDDDTAAIIAAPTEGLFTSEAGATVTFTVRLGSEPTDEVTLALSSSDSGEGTVSPASLSFTALNWTTPRTVTVTGVDDTIADGNQSLSILLDAVSGDLKYDALPAATVSVINTDNEPGSSAGQLQFSATNYLAGEQAGSRIIQVRRVGGSTGVVTVRYRTENGSATAPGDYAAQNGILSWADGELADKTFSVPIVNDTAAESDETVSLILSNPTGGAILGSPATATLTIQDNELPPSVRLGAAAYSVREGDGVAVVTVIRSGRTDVALSVDYATVNGTAVAPRDYVSLSGTLSWGAGDTSPRSISISIRSDEEVEDDESLTLILRNPSAGGSLGSPATATITITNSPVSAPGLRTFLPMVRR